MKYENQILDAIEMIVDKKVDTAKYDKTVQGRVISCEDPIIGKYKIQYQDSIFYAYAINLEISYAAGSEVYVLIPNNDMSRYKTILGAVNGIGQSAASDPESSTDYEIIGNNCIENNLTYNLCSYKITNEYVIYDRNRDRNELQLNLTSVNTYLKGNSSIALGATISTNLPVEQQLKGNYGIVYEIAFSSTSTDEIILKNYVLDINQFEGNPYNFSTPRDQLATFSMDGANFDYINRVYLFCTDFPNLDNEKPNDIFINNLSIYGSQSLDPSDLESYSLKIATPQGTYFDESDSEEATRLVQAQVRVKGRYINPETQILPYYWFVENNGITTSSEDYNSYGGQGWKCLNEKTVTRVEGSSPIVQWIAADYQRTIHKKDSAARETKYKCVVICNEVVLSKIFTITNYSSDYNITIVSDDGVQFYYDIGNPSLTCLINNQELSGNDYVYRWATIDNNNNFNSLLETVSYNIEYNVAKAAYDNLRAEIANETAMENANQELLQRYLTTINKYDKIMRVEGGKIHHLQVNTISNYTTYKCSVYHNDVYIGTASITIYNNLNKDTGYRLVINNGAQVFKYDKMGLSPSRTNLDSPQEISKLSFTVYNDLGKAISDDIFSNCEIEWLIPYEDTLLEVPDTYETEESDGYKIIKNLTEISYNIKDVYNKDSLNNDIRLKVKYEDINLIAATDLIFFKDDNLDLNGTKISCNIVPNTTEKNFGYPMVLNGILNYTPLEEGKWFKAQLWKNNEKIFEGYSSNSEDITIEWEILKNQYTNNISDTTSLSVSEDGTFSYLRYNGGDSPANIIKVTIEYNGTEYYASFPLITAETAQDYNISLRKGSGFNKVIYNERGDSPRYDMTMPFTLDVLQKINDVWENVSTLTKDYAVEYNWQKKGRFYSINKAKWEDKSYLSISDTTLKNQKLCYPSLTFNGFCTNNALECIVSSRRLGEVVAKIHIPIHLVLEGDNPYFKKWDGNRINLEENAEKVLLAPRTGIGEEKNQNFSGLFLGQVKERNQDALRSGFFGYREGQEFFFIDSENGITKLGYNGYGQLVLDEFGQLKLRNSDILIDISNETINWTNNNFTVDNEGKVTIKKGNLAGFIIENNLLTAGSGNTKIGFNSNSQDEIAFWAGSANHSSAPFYVDYSGNIHATKGTIGGWIVNSGELTSSTGAVHLSSSGALRGPNWIIAANGHTSFKDIEISSANSSLSASSKILDIGTFYVQKNGYTYIASGFVNGNVVSTGIDATNITRGNLNITSGSHYFRMDFESTKDPAVSGLLIGSEGSNITSNSAGDIIIKGAVSESNIKVHTARDGAVTLKSYIQGVIDGIY